MTNIRVAGIIIEEKDILTTRMEKNGDSYYVLPGGGVEQDENIEEALEREIKEETGLKITDFSLAYIRELKLSENERGIEFYYHIREYTGEPETGYDPEEKDSSLREIENLDIEKLSENVFFPEQLVDKLPEDAKTGFQEVKHLGIHPYRG